MNEVGCKTKVGMLVLHDCDRPAVDNCTACGRPICKRHRVKRQGEVLCAECAEARDRYREDDSVLDSRTTWFAARRRYYSRYHYRPYYHGYHRYYSDEDFRAFDEDALVREPGPGEAPDQDDDDFSGVDDALES